MGELVKNLSRQLWNHHWKNILKPVRWEDVFMAGRAAVGLGALGFDDLGMSNEIGAIEMAIIWPQYVKGRIPLYILTLSWKYWPNSFICFDSEQNSISQEIHDERLFDVDWCNLCSHNWSWNAGTVSIIFLEPGPKTSCLVITIRCDQCSGGSSKYYEGFFSSEQWGTLLALWETFPPWPCVHPMRSF